MYSIKQTIAYQLNNLRKINHYVNTSTAKLITHSLILSRLNFYNSILTGTKTNLQTELDKLRNRSIQIVYRLPNKDYTTLVTTSRRQLNWFSTSREIDFKILTLLFKILKTTEPSTYITVLH